MLAQASDFEKVEPDVTVIIPCYNYGRYLKAAVASALRNSNFTIQVLVINDCSSDETRAIADDLASRDARVRVLNHDSNWGHIATYNHGLALVEGRYVHLISADDELAPGALDRAVAIMDRHLEVGMVYGAAIVGSLQRRPVPRNPKQSRYVIVNGRDWVEARCLDGRNPIYSPEVTLRTSVAKAAGNYDPRLPRNADLHMWLKAAARGDVGIVQGADQALYRLHDQNMHSAHAMEGRIAGFRERAMLYEDFFSSHAGLIDDAATLHRAAMRRLARDVAMSARRMTVDKGVAVTEVSEFLELAMSLDERATECKEWKIAYSWTSAGARLRSVQSLSRLVFRARDWVEWHTSRRDLGVKGLRPVHIGHLAAEKS